MFVAREIKQKLSYPLSIIPYPLLHIPYLISLFLIPYSYPLPFIPYPLSLIPYSLSPIVYCLFPLDIILLIEIMQYNQYCNLPFRKMFLVQHFFLIWFEPI